jgi:hypothetical protein
MNCPECDSAETTFLRKRHAFYPVLYVFVLQIPFCLLHQSSCPCEYRCRKCAQTFWRRSGFEIFSLALLLGTIVSCVFLPLLIASLLLLLRPG